MILISVVFFHQSLSVGSIIGCILTIAGSFWYSVERYNFDIECKKNDPIEGNTSDREPFLKHNERLVD